METIILVCPLRKYSAASTVPLHTYSYSVPENWTKFKDYRKFIVARTPHDVDLTYFRRDEKKTHPVGKEVGDRYLRKGDRIKQDYR